VGRRGVVAGDLKDRLARFRQIKISVIGRKSGKTISIPVHKRRARCSINNFFRYLSIQPVLFDDRTMRVRNDLN